jgi:hypothetical protein
MARRKRDIKATLHSRDGIAKRGRPEGRPYDSIRIVTVFTANLISAPGSA